MYKVVRLSKKKFFVEKAPRYVFWMGALSKFIYVKLCLLQLKIPVVTPVYRWYASVIHSRIVYYVKTHTSIFIGEQKEQQMRLLPLKKKRK